MHGLCAARWYWCPGAHRYRLEKNPWMLRLFFFGHIEPTGAWKNSTFSTWSYCKLQTMMKHVWISTWTLENMFLQKAVVSFALLEIWTCQPSCWRHECAGAMSNDSLEGELPYWDHLWWEEVLLPSDEVRCWQWVMSAVAMLPWLQCFLVVSECPRTRPDTFSFTINGKTFKAKVPFNMGLAEQRNFPRSYGLHIGKLLFFVRTWLMGWFGGLTLPNYPTFGCSVFPCQVREQPDGSLYVSLGGALQCLVESYWNHHGTG